MVHGHFYWLFVALAIYALISKEGFDLFIACIATHAFFMSEKFLTTFFIYFFKGYSKDNSPILKFIYSRPQIIITGTTSKEGTVQYAPDQDERRTTIITDIKKNEFQYYSSRDISGPFVLNCDKCPLIPEIHLDNKKTNLILYSRCQNGHVNNKIDLLNYLENGKKFSKINFIILINVIVPKINLIQVI